VAKNFGDKQIVLQRGHGFVLWGHSVHEAYMLAFLVIRACETQVRSAPARSSLRAAASGARRDHRPS